MPPASDADEFEAIFNGPFNATKRQALAVKLGLPEANRLAKSYGFTGLFDRGLDRKPDAAGTDKRKNPWAYDGPDAQQKRIDFIRRVGATAAAGLAKAAGRTIDGKPLRQRAV